MAKTAIITGGSRGIGEAMALKLGELGFNVVINYRSESSKSLSDNLAATSIPLIPGISISSSTKSRSFSFRRLSPL